jgi:hypothetical protein
MFHRLSNCVIGLFLVAAFQSASAQIVNHGDRLDLTLEGYANLTTEPLSSVDTPDRSASNDLRVDAALRGLARWKNADGPDLGLRLVVESSPQSRANLAEASFLLLGSAGRLEFGTRPGLPDVLTGYAPNNFAFTSAEFGPASGPSLDPGGGLQHAFLRRGLASQLDELAALGASASLANDRSAKLVYVSPKRKGFLAGLSYAPNAEDPRFSRLLQAGLVHERYWDTNILRIGGSVSLSQASSAARTQRSLRSINAGATLILDNDWMLGISGTWNGTSGLSDANKRGASDAYGATASINYNLGRWTAGAYYQLATTEGDALIAGRDLLRAVELGVSYRFTTKLRVFGALYSFDFDDEGGSQPIERHRATMLLIGARATL